VARFSGRKVRVRSYALDIEAAVLGGQIITSLRGANIGLDDNRMSEGALGAIAMGVRVIGGDKDLVDALLEALSNLGHLAASSEPLPPATGMSLGDDGTPVAATIFVGVKPLTQ
jgi:hypothetical protein